MGKEGRGMMCLKAKALGGEMYALRGSVLAVNLGSSMQRAMRRGGREKGEERAASHASDPSSPSSRADGSSNFQENKSFNGPKLVDWTGKFCCYRSQLEKEVQILQQQLQEEIDLHVVLENAVGHDAFPLSISPSKLPDKAMELLASINTLEITVAKLEEELIALHFRLHHERNVLRDSEHHLKVVPIRSPEHSSSTSGYMWEDHVSSLRVSKLNGLVPALQQDSSPGSKHLELVECSVEGSTSDEILGPCNEREVRIHIDVSLQKPIAESKNLIMKNLWQYPNELSEDMVLCMRNIFLCLSGSLKISPKAYLSECLSSPTSQIGHRSSSSLTSFSYSSTFPSSILSSSQDFNYNFEVINQEILHDPYGVNETLNWRDVGEYSLATDVSWMSVGKTQLEYAAEALKRFRFLVDQLAKVNPVKMCNNEKLAFWINLYNTLIMHAYLAYGVSRSDIQLFSLMQKACYTVGGQSFNATDIEFVLLKMKPPAHRPQIALMLALQKFKMTEEHRKYSVEIPEPMTLFALSCGMYSCPAVRIFTANNIQDDLQRSMRDYIRASVGINDKGKLLVPKLLYCFAKGVVQDSLLVDWICRYLTPDQAAAVRSSTLQRKQRLLGAMSFSIIPFDSGFRAVHMHRIFGFGGIMQG